VQVAYPRKRRAIGRPGRILFHARGARQTSPAVFLAHEIVEPRCGLGLTLDG
jgi:hypothetical protein